MKKVSRIPKPPDMPIAYRRAYWANWYRRLTHRPPDMTLTGVCVGCDVEGVLGIDLLHRGSTRPTNLFCDNCCSPSVIVGINAKAAKAASDREDVAQTRRVSSRKGPRSENVVDRKRFRR